MSEPLYEYKTVSVQDDVGVEAQNYANQGWRVVSVFPKARKGFWDIVEFELLLERVKPQMVKTWDERDLLPKSECGG